MPGSLFAIILAGVAAAASEPPDTVNGGVITVGRGAAGVTLWMTPRQARAKLGAPVRVDRFGGLRYQREGAGTFYLDLRYRDEKTIYVKFPRSKDWTLENGIRVFRPHAIPDILDAYSDQRILRVRDEGARSYQIFQRIHRHKTRFSLTTAFYVNRFNLQKARVLRVELTSTRCRPAPLSCFKP